MTEAIFDARTRTGSPTRARAVPGSEGTFEGDDGRTFHTREFLVPNPYDRVVELKVTAVWDGAKWVVRDPGQAHDFGHEVAKYVYAPAP